VVMEVHVFQTSEFTGQIKESEEMKPEWFNLNEVPFTKMWPDDVFWWPHLLHSRGFIGYFKYTRESEEITDYTMEGATF